jgi:hypothetical protein
LSQNFDCEATASMLDSGRVLALASQAAALIAAISPWNTLAHRLLFAVALVLWPLACWLAIRVAIDASLFRAMARDPEASARSLDTFLTAHGLAPAPSGRPLADRCRGALRLWRRLMFVAGLQMILVVSALLSNLW